MRGRKVRSVHCNQIRELIKSESGKDCKRRDKRGSDSEIIHAQVPGYNLEKHLGVVE